MKSDISVCITFCDLDFMFLNRSISMVNAQTVKPKEIILAYSGINGDIIHAESEIPIRFLKVSDKRVHQSEVRNCAAEFCDTEIISFFDVDDIISSQKVEFVDLAISKKGSDAFLHSYIIGNHHSIPIFDNYSLSKITEKERGCSNVIADCGSPVTHGHISLKTKIFENIKQKKVFGEDGIFCQEILDAGYLISFSKNPLIIYYQWK